MDPERGARGLLAGEALALFLLWTRWTTDREGTARLLGVEAESAWGANTLRGDAGGALLAISGLLTLSLLRGARWLAPAAVVTAAVSVGRAVGLRRDGFDVRSVAALGFELLSLVAMAVLWRADRE
jgi:hypothetical protein